MTLLWRIRGGPCLTAPLQCLTLGMDSLSLLATPWLFSGLAQSLRLPEVQLGVLFGAGETHAHPTSWYPGAQFLGIRQWESSRALPVRVFSLDVGLRPEKVLVLFIWPKKNCQEPEKWM